MHPHVRAVAASLLCFDLGVDWRVGRDEWDRWLIEDDPALATGNWQWIAGVGADMAQYPRIYNPERQRRRYDPAGVYVRRWIRELRACRSRLWRAAREILAAAALALFAEGRIRRPWSITQSRRGHFCGATASSSRPAGSRSSSQLLTTGTRTSSPFQVLMP